MEYKVGDIVKFGKWGGESIEWQVLEVRHDMVLLLSRYGIDTKPYSSSYDDITWEKSVLRQWLNQEFFKSCFNETEQQKIVATTVKAEKNFDYNIVPGNDTEDKVFLLGISEAERYLPSDKERMCIATVFAKNKGTYVSVAGYSWWWLRTLGDYSDCAVFVDSDGKICFNCINANYTDVVVRPALWIIAK